MVIANLFKHKVNFRLNGHDPDRYEPYLYSKGYHYVSRERENGASIGVTDVTDLYRNELTPLFRHIISTMKHEMDELDHITIKVNLTCGEDYMEHDVIKFELEDYYTLESANEYHYYTLPENLLEEKFSIHVESYAYVFPDEPQPEDSNAQNSEAQNSEAQDDGEDPTMWMDVEVLVPNTLPEETFREERCVICLESAPNILFLDCMHIAVCDFCDSKKQTASLQGKCDVCRATISRKIRV